MALKDKERWNEKYMDNKMPSTPIGVLTNHIDLVKGTSALDIACGMGRHSLYLSDNGFSVDALDISSVAIEKLQSLGDKNINVKEVDFDTYRLKINSYDIIICSYFLERKLFPQIIEALKEGGIFIMETFLHHEDNERKASNPQFRLRRGELEEVFASVCEIIYLKEYWDSDYMGFKTMKTQIVARKN